MISIHAFTLGTYTHYIRVHVTKLEFCLENHIILCDFFVQILSKSTYSQKIRIFVEIL